MFSERLRLARRQKKLTQRELAEICDIHNKHVSKLEADKQEVSPRSDIVVKLANALGVTTDYLLRPEVESSTGGEIQDSDLKRLFSTVTQMAEDDQQTIKKLIEAFAQARAISQMMAAK